MDVCPACGINPGDERYRDYWCEPCIKAEADELDAILEAQLGMTFGQYLRGIICTSNESEASNA